MHTAVIDLGYGDAGKGAVVDRLCAKGDVDLVVRFNGGCQAAHNVVTDDGRHHTFAQFGSGTFHGVPTYLSKQVMVEPLSLMIEARALASIGVIKPLDLLTISADARLTTPYHWKINRYREHKRGASRHGSCGRGIGATAEYALLHPDTAPTVGDLTQPKKLLEKLRELEYWMRQEAPGEPLPDITALITDYQTFVRPTHFSTHITSDGLPSRSRIVFEGAQGLLLDEHLGFHPYTTWSTVSTEGLHKLVSRQSVEVIGVTRAYSTRHGAGPFVPENNTLDLPESHNQRERYQGGWRIGHLDVPALRWAIAGSGHIDKLYVTHLDTAEAESRLQVCTDYKHRDGNPLDERFAADNFVARAEQSAALLECRPVLIDRPLKNWADSCSELLGLPLAGYASGPRTDDGVLL